MKRAFAATAAAAGHCGGGAMVQSCREQSMEEFMETGISPRPHIATSKNHSALAGQVAAACACGPQRPEAGAGAEQYVLLLKKLLDLCQATGVRPRESHALTSAVPCFSCFGDVVLPSTLGARAKSQELPSAKLNSQASDVSQLSSQSSVDGQGQSRGLTSHDIQNTVVVGNLASTCSSKELSDNHEDDIHEGETGRKANVDLADERRIKRMLANRESARRSRKRKQDHIDVLQEQVSQLRTDNANLIERLTNITRKYNELVADNEILKADVETMSSKVKIAADTLKCANDTHLLSPNMPDMTMNGIPFSPCLLDSDDVLAGGNESMNFFHTPVRADGIQAYITDTATLGVNINSMEHTSKRICRGSSFYEQEFCF